MSHFARTQILANCAVLFPTTSPTLLTVSDLGVRRIFVTCLKSGQLLLEHQGTWHDDFFALLNRTEDMMEEHIGVIRTGKAAGRGGVDDGLLHENQELRKQLAKSTEMHTEALKMAQVLMERFCLRQFERGPPSDTEESEVFVETPELCGMGDA